MHAATAPFSALGSGEVAQRYSRSGEAYERLARYLRLSLAQHIASLPQPVPWPTHATWEDDSHVLRIGFAEHEPAYLRITSELAHGTDPRDFDEREILRIWSQAYEDTGIERQLNAAREHYLNAMRLSSDHPMHIELAQRMFESQSDQIRRSHYANAYAQQNWQANALSGLGQQAQYAQGLANQAQAQGSHNADLAHAVHRMDVLYGYQYLYSSWLATGDPEVEARGLRLLKENLTPVQLTSYEKHTFFEVVGGHSGKTYRIRHGRQMNIDELSTKGDKVMGWCFLPSGGLCAGDVMLGQKIALEGDERAALKIANKFPVHGTGLAGQSIQPVWFDEVAEVTRSMWDTLWP